MKPHQAWRPALVAAGRRWGWHLAYAKWSWTHVHPESDPAGRRVPAAGEGRRGSATLLVHAMNTWSVVDALVGELAVLGPLSDEDRSFIDLTAFLHDAGKQRTAYQEAIRTHRQDPRSFRHLHFPDPEEFLTLTRDLGLDEEMGLRVLSAVQAAGAPEGARHYLEVLRRKSVDPRWSEVVHLADVLASLKDPEEAGGMRPAIAALLERYRLDLAYHRIGLVRGLLSRAVHQSLERCYRARGYRPLLYFAHGTVYVARRGATDSRPIVRDEVESAVVYELAAFHAQDPQRLGARAVGSYTATKVNPLAYAVYSHETLVAFLESVKAKRFASHPDPKPQDIRQLQERRPGADLGHLEAEVSRIRAWGGYLMYVVDLLKQLNAGDLLDEAAAQSVWPMIEELSHSTGFARLIDIWEKSGPLLGHDAEDVHRWVLQEVVPRVLPRVPADLQLTTVFRTVANQLVGEVVFPELGNAEELVRTVSARYLSGRVQAGTPLCVWCGQPAATVAIGAGSEHFLNALAAGAHLGGQNKAWVCRACELEQNMRRLITGRDTLDTGWYVIPQILQGEELFREWTGLVDRLMQQTEHVGRSPLGDIVGLAKMVQRGLSEPDDAAATERFFAETALPKRLVQRWISEQFGDNEDALAFLNDDLQQSFPSMEEAVFRLASDPDAAHRRASELKAFLRAAAGVHLVASPWFVLVLAESDLGGRDGSDSVRSLRRVFVAQFLARLLLATVVVPDNPLPPLATLETRGWVEFQGTLVNRPILKSIGVSAGQIPFPEGDRVLRQLGALLQAEDLLRRRGHMGEDTLLQAARRPAGQLLQRLAQAQAGRAGGELLDYMRVWDPAIDRLLAQVGLTMGPADGAGQPTHVTERG